VGGEATPEIKVGGLGPCGPPGSVTYACMCRCALIDALSGGQDWISML